MYCIAIRVAQAHEFSAIVRLTPENGPKFSWKIRRKHTK